MPREKAFDIEATLRKAMHAFWSRGYEATSMQDLVERMEINRASLYAAYGDKHALFLAALRLYDEEMRRRALADLEARFPPREAIRQLFLAFTGQVQGKRPGRGCLLTNTALERAAHDPEAARIVAHAQEQIEAFFARMIARAQEAGETPARLDASAAAKGLLAALIGVIVLVRSRPDPKLLEAIVDEALSRLG